MREKLLNALEEVCPGIDFRGETDFVDNGVLESLDIVMIATELMHVFGIRITVEDLLPEYFNSVDGMLTLIQNKKS